MTRQLIRRIATWYRRHPDDGMLLSLHDGELSADRRARVQVHLKQCARCRHRAEQIAKDWNRLVEWNRSTAAFERFDQEQLTAKVRTSIDAFKAASLVAHSAGSSQRAPQAAAERQVAEILAVYLGRRAAAALLHAHRASSDSQQEGLRDAESVLRILLGEKPAAAIEAMICRIINQIPRSACGSSQR